MTRDQFICCHFKSPKIHRIPLFVPPSFYQTLRGLCSQLILDALNADEFRLENFNPQYLANKVLSALNQHPHPNSPGKGEGEKKQGRGRKRENGKRTQCRAGLDGPHFAIAVAEFRRNGQFPLVARTHVE